MKVRIKVSGAARAVDVGDGGSCTLAQLKDRTANVFQLQTPFHLSLNRFDAITGEDQTLSQLGIVPGDLLFVISSNQDNSTSTRSAENPSNSVSRAVSASTSASSVSSVGVSAGLQAFNLSDSGVLGEFDPELSTSTDGFASHATASSTQTEPIHTASMDVNVGRASERDVGRALEPDVHTSEHDVGDTSECENDSISTTNIPSAHLGTSSSATTNIEDPSQSLSVDDRNNDYHNSYQAQSPSPSHLLDPEVNRCLQEPLMCRESTSSSVPALLQNLYVSAGCAKPVDALWVVVHSLIMEVGFRPLQDNDLSMDAGWNRHGFFKATYTYLSVSTEHVCTVMGVPMGSALLVHGFTTGDVAFKTERLQLQVSDFVSSVDHDVRRVYNNLERLSRMVKDLTCQPLLAHFGEVCGFPVSLGLMALSHELKLKVLSYLPAESLVTVAQVCRLIGVIYRDPWLWRRLYLREFGRNGDNSLNKDWYNLYKEEWLLRRERRKAARLRQQMVTGIPPWLNPRPGHFPPLGSPPFPGGIIGGDYDFNPEFTSNIPHPLFGRPPAPGFFFPRPRFFDPFGGPPDDPLGHRPARPSPGGPRFGSSFGNTRPSAFGSFGNRFI